MQHIPNLHRQVGKNCILLEMVNFFSILLIVGEEGKHTEKILYHDFNR